jgi:hypothetical protein
MESASWALVSGAAASRLTIIAAATPALIPVRLALDMRLPRFIVFSTFGGEPTQNPCTDLEGLPRHFRGCSKAVLPWDDLLIRIGEQEFLDTQPLARGSLTLGELVGNFGVGIELAYRNDGDWRELFGDGKDLLDPLDL